MEKYISTVKTPKVSVAPMVDRTDRYFRYFCRIITKKALLYTEMITAQAIIHGDRRKLLDFDEFEKPVALQIAGCDPKQVYEAVKLAEEWNYDEINLNVGCPSDRVSGNEMGAVLMAYPALVAEMVSEMRRATKKPITVKHRIGIEGKGVLPSEFKRTLLDQYEDMVHFINVVEKAKADRFTIHARIAILAGLSPKENREIPPLRYEEVYALKRQFPYLQIELNGGIKTIAEIKEHLQHVDGVMIGRAAYENPYILSQVDQFFEDGEGNQISRREIIEKMIPYVEELDQQGIPAHKLLRHTQGLFAEKRGSRQWRQMTSPPWKQGQQGKDILQRALQELPIEILEEKL